MQQIYRKIFFFALLALILITTGGAQAIAQDLPVEGYARPWQLNFQPPATQIMENLNNLHNYLLYMVFGVSAFVVILLGYVCVRFNRSRNPVPSKTTHHTLLEVMWTVIPVMILVAIAIPSLRYHYFMDKTEDPQLTLKVTGYQWYWGYEYPDQEGLSFESYIKKDEELKEGDIRLLSVDKPVVVPINTNVRVLLTAADVIHAWAIPAFGVKRDAMPGRLNETWFNVTKPGVYYGQCSELCGQAHGFMPIEVHAVEKEVFDAWVERAKGGDFSTSWMQQARQTLRTASASHPSTNQ